MPNQFSCESLCDPSRSICLLGPEIVRVVNEIESLPPDGVDPLNKRHAELARSALDLLSANCRAIQLGMSIVDLYTDNPG